MSKFENLSAMIWNHEDYWAKLGSKLTTGQPLGKSLAHFYKVVWDPWFAAWTTHESSCKRGECDDGEIDRLTDVAARGLSRIRGLAKTSYSLPIPDLGSAGPGTYAGAVSLIGAWNPWGLDFGKPKAPPKKAPPRRTQVSDHRSNPGGYDPRALSRRPMPGRGSDDVWKQLRDQEAQGAQDADVDPFADDGDGQTDVASGWWGDAVSFVKKHTSDIKDAATFAGGAIGGKIGEQIASTAVDAALGSPAAAKKIAAAIDHPDPKIAATAVAVVAATKQVIQAKQVQVTEQPHKADPALSLMASWG